jgi:hypothetical protein
MKALFREFFLSFLALTSITAAANAGEAESTPILAGLTCVASNGATMKSTATATERGLVVISTWGALKKDFDAYVSGETKKGKLYINLDNGKTIKYVLALGANTTLLGTTQKVSGVILEPKPAFGPTPRLVTFIRCEVALR